MSGDYKLSTRPCSTLLTERATALLIFLPAALLPVTELMAQSGPTPLPVYNVVTYHADNTGGVEASSAVQQAINDAQDAGGGIVFFPAGTYLVNSGVTITKAVVLQGIGWSEQASGGSIIKSTNGAIGVKQSAAGMSCPNLPPSPITISYTANHANIRDLKFIQDQPPDGPEAETWTPRCYPPSIDIPGEPNQGGGAAILEDLMFRGVYEGVSIGDRGTEGRITMRHIYGEFFDFGVNVVHAEDTDTFEDFHFWPFESSKNIVAYVLNNSSGIRIVRSDNPFLSNIFMLGYSVGLFAGSGNGGTAEKIHISNMDIDGGNTGILLSPTSGALSAQIVNFTFQSPYDGQLQSTAGYSVALDIEGAQNVTLDIVNFRGSQLGANVIRCGGSANVDVALTNVWLDNWNITGKGFPGIEMQAGCTVTLSGITRVLGGNGANPTSGNVFFYRLPSSFHYSKIIFTSLPGI